MDTHRVLVIGLDGGGSHTHALLADAAGKVLGSGSAACSNLQTAGEEAAKGAVLQAVDAAFASAKLPRQPAAVICLGMAGVDRPEDERRVRSWVKEAQLAQCTLVSNDSNLLLYAGTPHGWGIGVVSGTGSISFGRTAVGHSARAGGWGFTFGDEGSGYSIGVAALRAVAMSADGRAPATLLTQAILTHWGLAHPGQLITYVYNRSSVSIIAHLAQVVQSAAGQGDSTAVEILRAAGHHLALAVNAVCRTLGFAGEVPAALGGGVLVHDSLVRSALLQHITEDIHLDPIAIVEQPALGAVRLALQNLPT